MENVAQSSGFRQFSIRDSHQPECVRPLFTLWRRERQSQGFISEHRNVHDLILSIVDEDVARRIVVPQALVNINFQHGPSQVHGLAGCIGENEAVYAEVSGIIH